jgi:exopolysaccharide production protein ExoQ
MTSTAEITLPALAEKAFTVFVLVISTGAFLNIAIERGDNLEAGMPAMQALWTLIYVITAVLLYKHSSGLAKTLKNEFWLILVVGLCLLSTIWSNDPLLTGRRSIALICTTSFGVYFATRYGHRQQLRLLAVSFGLIIGFSFFFQLLGIGTSVDGVPGWIGIFTQKNALGLNMAFAAAIFLIVRKPNGQYSGLAGLAALLSCALLLLSESMTARFILGTLILTLFFCRNLIKSNRALFFFLSQPYRHRFTLWLGCTTTSTP